MTSERPTAFTVVTEEVAKYASTLGGQGCGSNVFGRPVLPYPKGTDEFWWYLLLCCKPFTSFSASEGGDMPLISGILQNSSQTPEEECALVKDSIKAAGFNMDYIFGDAPEKQLAVVQLDPTSNFLDRKAYKRIDRISESKFTKFCMDNALVPRSSEIPRYLNYNLVMFTNSDLKIDLLKHNDHLRNQPATLLTLPEKTLTPQMNVFGKAFLVADGLDLNTEEVREIVIFCMGQAECLELKMKSWDKLRLVLQEEARKFALNAEHLRR